MYLSIKRSSKAVASQCAWCVYYIDPFTKCTVDDVRTAEATSSGSKPSGQHMEQVILVVVSASNMLSCLALLIFPTPPTHVDALRQPSHCTVYLPSAQFLPPLSTAFPRTQVP